ncbi:hypothetical protein ACA910_019153 [Epithemia clementina (nom. ined.)]
MLQDQSTKADLFQDTKTAVSFTFTPRKRAAASQDQDEFDTQRFRVKLVPLPASLGDKPTPAIQRLTNNGVWSALVTNVEMLQGHIVKIGDSVSKRFKTTNDILQELEYKLSVLKTLVGECKNLLGTATAFESLHSLTDQVEQFRTGPGLAIILPSAVPTPPARVPHQMKHLEGKINNISDNFKHFWVMITGTIHGELQAIFQQHMYNLTSSFQTNLAQPTLHFLQTWLTSPATPGNKLEAALHQIESSV